MAPDIFSYLPKYYKLDFKREDIPVFQAKLKFPTDKTYCKFAPILFPEGKRNMKKLFWCVELTKVLEILLFDISAEINLNQT